EAEASIILEQIAQNLNTCVFLLFTRCAVFKEHLLSCDSEIYYTTFHRCIATSFFTHRSKLESCSSDSFIYYHVVIQNATETFPPGKGS
ncbi:hypothetical protein, partial [Paenibacillus hemerocallicola]|uniref:hypothetical protein n=1 Tax=Paenibacillus hemerocallicola TaxID=1172614 RepID=UPI001C404ACB